MNRFLIFFVLIIISGIYLQGRQLSEDLYQEKMSFNNHLPVSFQEELSDSFGIPLPAINIAVNGFSDFKDQNLLKNDSLLTIIDFSASSIQNRFFIIDLKNKKLLKHTLVAHGKNSGLDIAETFSNKKHSRKSSLGFYITGETYEGKHGFSLRLDGMSKDLNDNARKRAIVIHGANYVNQEFINVNGRIGRSFGCPALSFDEIHEIIDLIKEGSCLFIYHPSLIPISQEDLEKLP